MDLQPFCARPDQGRPYLEKPFTIGEFTYATNGHICVRAPALDGVGELSARADVVKIVTDKVQKYLASSNIMYGPAPKVDFPVPGDCEDCDGRGSEHDCPDCECTCKSCEGTGYEVVGAGQSVGIGVGIYMGRYIALMQTLPGLELGPAHATQPLRFRFDGGEGCLMPCSRPLRDHINTNEQAA